MTARFIPFIKRARGYRQRVNVNLARSPLRQGGELPTPGGSARSFRTPQRAVRSPSDEFKDVHRSVSLVCHSQPSYLPDFPRGHDLSSGPGMGRGTGDERAVRSGEPSGVFYEHFIPLEVERIRDGWAVADVNNSHRRSERPASKRRAERHLRLSQAAGPQPTR